jgi:hypothetical protein
MPTKPIDPIIRFWKFVDRKGPEDCWNWTGGCAGPPGNEYGSFQPGGRAVKRTKAHRFSYTIHCGPIPDGLFVMHTCDNRLCVNPAHLQLGTPLDNMRDKIAKGRERYPQGPARAATRLSEDNVRTIRSAPKYYGYINDLAARFGVGRGHINKILHREKWRYLQ